MDKNILNNKICLVPLPWSLEPSVLGIENRRALSQGESKLNHRWQSSMGTWNWRRWMVSLDDKVEESLPSIHLGFRILNFSHRSLDI